MNKFKIKTEIGYLWLSNFLYKQGINTYPYFRRSYLLEQGPSKVVKSSSSTEFYYNKINMEEGTLGHLEFALKHEGLHLQLIEQLLYLLDPAEIEQYILKNPKGKYSRIIWFFYEWLTSKELNIKDISIKTYVDLIDPDLYYTAEPIHYKRYAVKNNLLGNKQFCPIVRKNQILKEYDRIQIKEKLHAVLNKFNTDLLHKASYYLYLKETTASFFLSNEESLPATLNKFLNVITNFQQNNRLSKEFLIYIQQMMLDSRYSNNDYRTNKNYIGESLPYGVKINYICPKVEDVEYLMQGLIACYYRLTTSNLPPVLIATIISFGFLFIHPFEDGNGRIHRFLLHNILTKLNFNPPNIIFPISATILSNMKEYDHILQSYSIPLTQLINYDIDSNNRMEVLNDTLHLYKYIDMTDFVQYTYEYILDTINNSLPAELYLLDKYEKTKFEIKNIVDIPDDKLGFLLKLLSESNGSLAKMERSSYFKELSDLEVYRIQKTFKKYF